ncbi:MAG: hypothetical protein ABIQ18_18240 [Umezawaea sp.]
MVSRLPITTRSAHQEIAVSYLTRLAALHEMPVEHLWQQVSRPKATGTRPGASTTTCSPSSS